ncbi:hypothetical protein EDB85DRAFT_1081453 [Lactarius pseudohatsudake]|nr:hypothetical protein EDB85DRAFT_1081453 [Lactarius pseudohatsudake]
MVLTTTKVTLTRALVTGAARGIGRAIALRLADDRLDVGVNDTSSSLELDVRGDRKQEAALVFRPTDILLEPEVEKSIQRIVQDLGSLDVVNTLQCRRLRSF